MKGGGGRKSLRRVEERGTKKRFGEVHMHSKF